MSPNYRQSISLPFLTQMTHALGEFANHTTQILGCANTDRHAIDMLHSNNPEDTPNLISFYIFFDLLEVADLLYEYLLITYFLLCIFIAFGSGLSSARISSH